MLLARDSFGSVVALNTRGVLGRVLVLWEEPNEKFIL
jgi:hypothetical protein